MRPTGVSINCHQFELLLVHEESEVEACLRLFTPHHLQRRSSLRLLPTKLTHRCPFLSVEFASFISFHAETLNPFCRGLSVFASSCRVQWSSFAFCGDEMNMINCIPFVCSHFFFVENLNLSYKSLHL